MLAFRIPRFNFSFRLLQTNFILQDISTVHIENIVQPPAGFEDSPRTYQRKVHTKSIKKQEKRYRSEERWHPKSYSYTTRAKSEERVKDISNETK